MNIFNIFKKKERSVRNVFGLVHISYYISYYIRVFDYSNSSLVSLEGSLPNVNNFECNRNMLESLKGGPEIVEGYFNCSRNELTSLVGAPKIIKKWFECQKNNLTNLKDIHKHIKFIGDTADFSDNPIESHVVGLLLIEGLRLAVLDNKKVQAIINNHLRDKKDVLACIDELIEAGYPEFAKI